MLSAYRKPMAERYSCRLPMRPIGEDRESDIQLIRKSVFLLSGETPLLHALFEVSTEPPGQGGCLLITVMLRLWRRRRTSYSLLPFMIFGHIPLLGCRDPSLFLLTPKHAVTLSFSRWRVLFPLAELAKKAERLLR